MSNVLRLAGIETRRNAAVWFLPIIVAVSWWMLDIQIWTPFLWGSTNELLPQSFAPFAGPAMTGVAAWMAGRTRRRGMEDLLVSTARPAALRDVTLLASTIFWGVLACLIFAGYMMGQTALSATWGGPDLWPLAVVLLAVVAHAAWGFLVGGLVPSRFTPPVAGVAVLGIQQLAAQHRHVYDNGSSSSTWVNQLAVHNGNADQHALLYFGLAGVAVSAIVLRERRSIARYAMVAIAAGVAVAGMVMTWGEYPDIDAIVSDPGDPGVILVRNNFGQVIEVTYEHPEPVCKGAPVTVCTHPAYQPVLDRAIFDAADMVKPLVGLPGVPNRIEEHEAGFASGRNGRAYLNIAPFADRLVAADDTLRDGNLMNEAQIAIRDWLLHRSGWWTPFSCDGQIEPPPFNVGWSTPASCAATDRFEQFPPEAQRAWLERHYTDLRAGNLTLDDLP